MTVDDAIELVKEKDKRKIRCDCLDCRAQTVLVNEVERLQKFSVYWMEKFADQHALTERAIRAAEAASKNAADAIKSAENANVEIERLREELNHFHRHGY